MEPLPRCIAVIPAFNEERTVRDVAERARPHVAGVVVIDDGSTDGTSAVLASLPVTLLRHAANRGKADALWDGMQHALQQGATAVITLDADGQHRPEDIPRLIAAHGQHPNALVIGARLRDVQNAPRSRRFANRFADFWISWAAGHWVADSQSGFRLYPAELLTRLRVKHDRAHGFVLESEAVIEAARCGFRTIPVPIAAIYPTALRPSHFRPVKDITRIVLMVAAKLLSRGLYPYGLINALRERRRTIAGAR